MKRLLMLFAFYLCCSFSWAQCALQVIGFNADNPDQILLYVASDIPGNTTFYFTDNEWNGSDGFIDLSENEESWTSPINGVSAGNYILLQSNTPSCGTATGTIGLNAASSGGDQIYISTVPPAITGMSESDICFALDYSDGGTGMSGGFTGTNIDLIETDNGHFTSTAFSEAAIENAANWTLSGTAFDLINTITITGATACSSVPTIQFASSTSSFAEPGGMVNVCVTINDANATATTVEVALAGAPGTASTGDYSTNPTLIATLTFPANSANGTQQCISFTGINDSNFEGNETIHLILQNPSNGLLGTSQAHTTSILDDDFPIVITEIMYDPCSGGSPNFWTNEGDGEFIEIYNNGITNVDLSGWTLTDNDAGSFHFIFPNMTSIAPGEYIVVARQVIYLALDGNGDGFIDAGNPGAGSKIFNEDILEGASTGGDLNNTGDDIELETAMGVTIDLVNYNNLNPWPTCAGINDGISLVLLDPNLDNSLASSWYPSLSSGNGNSGGGTPGASNSGGACISNVSTNVTQSGCGTSNPITTVMVTFTTAYSAVSSYDIYQDGNFIGTYNAGSTAAGTYVYTTPNLAPTTGGTVNFEVRPTGAPANTCFTASANANIPSCPLPIELLHFTGIAQNEQVILQWQTASEKNNAYFGVERSKDGIHFSEIGQVEGIGTTSESQFYHFVDQQPFNGINYYRLRQVDTDDRFEYYKTIAVEFKINTQPIGISLYPTPVIDELSILFTAPLTGESTLTIFNLAGQKVDQINLQAETLQEVIPLKGLPAGMYFLVVKNNSTQDILRFIKL